MRRSRLPAVAAAILLGGCGATHGGQSTAPPVLFSQACGACHTLTGVYDPRRQGGDLLHFRSTRAQLVQLTREMPVRRALSRAQLDAIVGYVRAVESRRGGP